MICCYYYSEQAFFSSSFPLPRLQLYYIRVMHYKYYYDVVFDGSLLKIWRAQHFPDPAVFQSNRTYRTYL